VIAPPSGVRVWLANGHTDMRRGMNGLALQVQQALQRDPHAGDLYVFRGRRGDLLKVLWHDGLGMSLYAKRLDRGRFVSYGLCQRFGRASSITWLGALTVGWIRSAQVRTPDKIDGRSDSYAGVGYPMMTVRRRAASLWPRTWAVCLSNTNSRVPSTAPGVLADADRRC
jgi:transposase